MVVSELLNRFSSIFFVVDRQERSCFPQMTKACQYPATQIFCRRGR